MKFFLAISFYEDIYFELLNLHSIYKLDKIELFVEIPTQIR
jgi:hypothetical protein